MLPRGSHAGLLAVAGLVSLLTVACEKVPLLAPTGSTITLTASANALSANGTTTIIGQVLEPAGTPPHSGTHVTFTTTLGRVEPAEVSTDVSGRVTVTFHAGSANGTATIAALSGGATTGTDGAVRISVGTAAVGNVAVNASPSTVPSAGGSSTISAAVLDVNGNPLVGAPVSFSTTAGTLSSTRINTDANGNASVVLTTSQQATVTASVGAQAPVVTPAAGGTASAASGTASGSVVVNVASAPGILITPPASSPSKGIPATFTFAVSAAAQNPSAIRSIVVSWGDGDVQNLGTFTGSQVQTHVFRNDGSFIVSATVTDAAGSTSTTSTSVFVVEAPLPGVDVTYTKSTTVAREVTFRVVITVPAGIGIASGRINFGDSTSQSFGGGTSRTIPPHVYPSASGAVTYEVEVNVTDTLGREATGTTTVTIP